MNTAQIRAKLEQALEVDVCPTCAYVNITEPNGEILSIVAFETAEEAETQKQLLIDSLISVLIA